ncbi:hypothetical protein JWG39_05180 [Desulforhopalus vacuolatus]|uniref:hypothetical protein n=1 Tax=Desulforhopalus vacuolatus TaxID=40414 RepID=UPI00196279F2|nr:hypothetical protein [Desulforhopalus vacuolatus]MBM9519212.1 hypothetical protein [Desulforhopalus vacuolatus]
MMKSKIIIYIVLGFLFIFCQNAYSRMWVIYVNDKVPSNYDLETVSEVFDYEKKPFKDLLATWEQSKIQEEQIKHYEKYGITKSQAQHAIEERLRLSRALVRSRFLGVKDISPAFDSLDNRVKAMDYIVGLGHDRFKSLINKFGIKLGNDFFQCLCHSQGLAGTSLGYSPAPDKHCNTTAPCKGGNWGCVCSDLPKDGVIWADCAKKYHTADGKNIFDRFGEHINVCQKERNDIIKNLQERSQVHRKNCLPHLSERSLQEMQSMLKIGLAAKAAKLAEDADNICEESIVVNLFLNENQSKYSVAVVMEGLAQWLPDKWYVYGKLNDAMVSEVGSNVFNTTLGKTINVLSFANNAMANKKLVEDEIKARKTDEIYRGALELFQKSKSWNVQQLRNIDSTLREKINEVNNEISKLKYMYLEEYNEFYTKTMLKIGDAIDARRKKLERELIMEGERLENNFNSRKAELLMKRANLLLKKSIINDYRIPFLEEGGCKKYLVKREASCKARLAEQKRLREKKIRENALKKVSEYRETKTTRTNPTSTNIIKPEK